MSDGGDKPAIGSRGRPITRLDDLAGAGLLASQDVAKLGAVVERFQLRLTEDVAALVDTGAACDPIARQFVPDIAEATVLPHELTDPIGDDVHEKVAGITHRYPDRVLLKPTHLCQVYCRFCFRREKVGDGQETLSEAEIDAAIDYIAKHDEIFEVILTGGDPLILSDRRLAQIFDRLEDIPHVEVVRLHTRVATVDPARITDQLVKTLRRRFATWIGVHVNHVSEFTPSADAAIARLVDGGIPLVSQTVLLKGVNDSVDALSGLMRGFVKRRIKPYYLHHLDFAEGTNHFRVPLGEGKALYEALRGHVTGLGQPSYIIDIPGGFGKVPVSGDWIHPLSGNRYSIRDWQGRTHIYEEPPQT